MHPGQGAARHSQLPAIRSAAGEHDRIRSGPQLLDPEIDPDLHPDPEARALGPQLIKAPVKPALLHPELRDPVAQQAPDPIGPLVDHHVVTGPGELLGGRQPGRTRTDHGDHAPGPSRRPQRGEPPPSTGVIDDPQLHLLDRDRIGVDRQHAGVLARGRAQRAGELGEVVRGVQPIRRTPPLTPPDQLVPVRDQIPQRATRVTKRHPAVHTPTRLHPLLLIPHRHANLAPIPQAQLDRTPPRRLPRRAQKPHQVAHGRSPRLTVPPPTSRSTRNDPTARPAYGRREPSHASDQHFRNQPRPHPAPRTPHPAPRTPHPAPRTPHPAPTNMIAASPCTGSTRSSSSSTPPAACTSSGHRAPDRRVADPASPQPDHGPRRRRSTVPVPPPRPRRQFQPARMITRLPSPMRTAAVGRPGPSATRDTGSGRANAQPSRSRSDFDQINRPATEAATASTLRYVCALRVRHNMISTSTRMITHRHAARSRGQDLNGYPGRTLLGPKSESDNFVAGPDLRHKTFRPTVGPPIRGGTFHRCIGWPPDGARARRGAPSRYRRNHLTPRSSKPWTPRPAQPPRARAAAPRLA